VNVLGMLLVIALVSAKEEKKMKRWSHQLVLGRVFILIVDSKVTLKSITALDSFMQSRL